MENAGAGDLCERIFSGSRVPTLFVSVEVRFHPFLHGACFTCGFMADSCHDAAGGTDLWLNGNPLPSGRPPCDGGSDRAGPRAMDHIQAMRENPGRTAKPTAPQTHPNVAKDWRTSKSSRSTLMESRTPRGPLVFEAAESRGWRI